MSNVESSSTLLQQQLSQLIELENLLLAEKEVLQQQKPDALTDITEKKQQLLSDIEQLDTKIKANAEFVEQLANNLLPAQFQEIETTLVRCKELNTINGQIIQHSSLAIERIRSTILESRSRSSMTYDKLGKKSGGLAGKAIKA